MSDIQEHVAFLSREIGARPAGTEEERQAALYIADSFERDAGLRASVEDIACDVGCGTLRAAVCALLFVIALLSAIVPFLVVPGLILTLLLAAALAVDALVLPLFDRLPRKDASQNVVARYVPGDRDDGRPSSGSRKRKVVLLARYDSGKARRDLARPVLSVLTALRWAELGAAVAVPVLLLLRLALPVSGAMLVVLNVLTVVAALVALLPAVSFILERTAPYGEAANCNAAGTAVLLEVATRIGQGRAHARDAAPLAAEPVMHGRDSAVASGFVPEGAELVYEPARAEYPEEPAFAENSPEARLLAAKAAIAALSGKPVSRTVNIDFGSPRPVPAASPVPAAGESLIVGDVLPPQGHAAEAAPVQAALAEPEAGFDAAPHDEPGLAEAAAQPAVAEEAPVQEEATSSFGSDVPDWFRSAQEKARKSQVKAAPSQRSRLSDALDAATGAGAATAQTEFQPDADVERRLQEMRENIMRGAAPRFEDEAAPPAAAAPVEEPAPAPAPVVAEAVASAPAPVPAAPVVEQPLVSEDAANRTVAFIPVPLDGEALQRSAARQAPAADDGSRALAALYGEPAPAAAPQPAWEEPGGGAAARNRRDIALPSLTGSLGAPAASFPAAEVQPAPSVEDKMQRLRASLPSLSGAIPMPSAAAPDAAARPIGSPRPSDSAFSEAAVTLSGTARATTIPSIPLELDGAGDEVFVDDVDESAFGVRGGAESLTASGYVDMPKSRFFGKRRRNRKSRDDEMTPQQWLNVDEGFDARDAGRARGGWESFREDEPGQWNGGGFSPSALKGFLSRTKAKDEMRGDAGAELFDEASDERYEEPPFDGQPAWSDEPPAWVDVPQPAFPEQMHEEHVRDIHGFRYPDLDVEVWFVALGAELTGNAGMDAFLAEHAEELRGAVFVELDGLGAGELTLMEEEGSYFPKKISSRLVRLARKAGSIQGGGVASGSARWLPSSAGFALKQGYQAMHLAGVEGGKPAFLAEAGDVLENLNERKMLANADFVMELIEEF